MNNYQQPPQQPQMQPQQPQGYAQPQPQTQPQPQAQEIPQNATTFIADDKVLELIRMVHPQLASAMINIAIKKFTEDPDYIKYFVKDENKQVVAQMLEIEMAQKESFAQKEPVKNAQQTSTQTQASNPAVDFTHW